MIDDIKNPSNRVDRAADGTFHALWHGRMIYQNGRVRRFKTQDDAWEFLARCDLEDKIIH